MDTTRRSLILSLRGGQGACWQVLDRLYRPLVIAWLRGSSVPESDVEDVAQEVMLVVMRRIGDFDHNGRRGAFRKWLKSIAWNAARSAQRRGPKQAGSSLVDDLHDAGAEVDARIEREHVHHLLMVLMHDVAGDFEPQTLEAFRLHVLEGLTPTETAERLGISTRAVYIAKSRLMRRLREAADARDDDP